eukprot:jgi/Chrpa1/17957/Chrysochromulina_OHIO_Genome00019618-RA
MVEATVAKERVAARVAEMRASVNAGEKRMAAEKAAAAMELASRAVAAEAWVAALDALELVQPGVVNMNGPLTKAIESSYQRPSEAIRIIRGHQRSSEVIRGHQRHSTALSGTERLDQASVQRPYLASEMRKVRTPEAALKAAASVSREAAAASAATATASVSAAAAATPPVTVPSSEDARF